LQLLPSLNQPGGPEVRWTTMARTAYGRLFKAVDHPSSDEGGPATIPEPTDEAVKPTAPKEDGPAQLEAAHQTRPLRFAFAPDIRALVDPSPASLVSPATLASARPWLATRQDKGREKVLADESLCRVAQLPGTDTHALHEGAISIACVPPPLLAFALSFCRTPPLTLLSVPAFAARSGAALSQQQCRQAFRRRGAPGSCN
jgi:hypothetical protein